ncbi:hypothetical protein HUT16_28120 [Kitasatospora sp. NA04385]|uniref:DUF6269 family protein n=1 Tax=Kitasatospora sp. NA04385 TaxID=2742135 RepID=UPI001590CC04|nr:DUF6269 family protein [Kitasatospora sp. NA04385]QKW22427.1 hypothetical protein HUT16_28120 [Kitasatospora sp. NA04385]
MNQDERDPARVHHPLCVLRQIEQAHEDQETAQLRASELPWGEVLAAYIDALTELITLHAEAEQPDAEQPLGQSETGRPDPERPDAGPAGGGLG